MNRRGGGFGGAGRGRQRRQELPAAVYCFVRRTTRLVKDYGSSDWTTCAALGSGPEFPAFFRGGDLRPSGGVITISCLCWGVNGSRPAGNAGRQSTQGGVAQARAAEV